MPIGLHTAELNFETLREIGHEGKNSLVFIAHDKQFDDKIVVKKILKSEIPNATQYYEEVKKLYASSHSNVVSVYYGCSDIEHIYIAMPFYKRGSLKSVILENNLTIREIIRYSIQFLSGLHHIHSKGLIHFDIKLDNILISNNNEALISDFGLTKAMDKSGFAEPEKIYAKQLPPESLTSHNKTLHFDIYQSGLALYRMLNGEARFIEQFSEYKNQEDYFSALLQGEFPNRDSYLSHIPLKLQRIVNKALSVDITDRHKNVLELINELSEIEENLDWRFHSMKQTQIWEKSTETHILRIKVDFTNPKNISIFTTKTNKSTSIETNEKKHCHNNLTSINVSSKIKQALRL